MIGKFCILLPRTTVQITDPLWEPEHTFQNCINGGSNQVIPIVPNYFEDPYYLMAVMAVDPNYPVTNLYNNFNLHKELRNLAPDFWTKTTPDDTAASGFRLSAASNGILNGGWNSVGFVLNKNNPDAYKKIDKIGVVIYNEGVIKAAFMFCRAGAVDYSTDSLINVGPVYDEIPFLHTTKWNEKEGLIFIDKEMIVQYAQMKNGTGAEEWANFTDYTGTQGWVDIFATSIPGEANGNQQRLGISNAFIGKTFDVAMQPGVKFEPKPLGIVTEVKETGVKFIRRGLFTKNLSFDLALFSDAKVHSFLRNIAMQHLNNFPLLYFPYCEVNKNKVVPLGQDAMRDLNLRYGGLYLLNDPKITHQQYNIHSTAIDLEEFK